MEEDPDAARTARWHVLKAGMIPVREPRTPAIAIKYGRQVGPFRELPVLAKLHGWLKPWAAQIVGMRDSGIPLETIARAIEPLVDAHYREQGQRGAVVNAEEIREALWLSDNATIPPPPREPKYTGFLYPILGKITEMYKAGYKISTIMFWVRQYQWYSERPLYGDRHTSVREANIRYALTREGLIQDKLPKPKPVPSDIEIYEDTHDCVYAAWSADRALAWRNRSRPIDMGGPRHRWIERSEWDLH